MATLHVICGKAGTGKTTLARALARGLNAIVICEDEWLVRVAEPITSLQDYIKATTRLRGAVAPHVIELLKLGVSVIFDFAGNTPMDRPGCGASSKARAPITCCTKCLNFILVSRWRVDHRPLAFRHHRAGFGVEQ